MSKIFLASGLALMLATGVAAAQTTTTSSESTTTVTPAPAAPLIAPPPVGTLSVTRTVKVTAPDGTQTDKTETTYRNPEGVANESTTTTTVPPVAAGTTTSWNYSSSTVVTPVPMPHSCPPHNKYDAATESCVTQ